MFLMITCGLSGEAVLDREMLCSVCCSVLQCVAVCCSVLQCVTGSRDVMFWPLNHVQNRPDLSESQNITGLMYTGGVCVSVCVCMSVCLGMCVRVDAHAHAHAHTHTHAYMHTHDKYGVATISRLLKIIGLFCKRAL